jgi:hypothetical protein
MVSCRCYFEQGLPGNAVRRLTKYQQKLHGIADIANAHVFLKFEIPEIEPAHPREQYE